MQKDEEVAKREAGLREKEKQIAEAKRTLDEQITDHVGAQLKTERARVIAEEAKKAKLASAAELDAKARELTDLQEVLKSREEKLAEAQRTQANLIKKQRERAVEISEQPDIEPGVQSQPTDDARHAGRIRSNRKAGHASGEPQEGSQPCARWSQQEDSVPPEEPKCHVNFLHNAIVLLV